MSTPPTTFQCNDDSCWLAEEDASRKRSLARIGFHANAISNQAFAKARRDFWRKIDGILGGNWIRRRIGLNRSRAVTTYGLKVIQVTLVKAAEV